MSLPFLLFLSVSAVSTKLSEDCVGFFSLEAACNSLTLEVLQEWPKLKPIPSLKSATSVGSTCMEALDCAKSLECSEKDEEIKRKVTELDDLCDGIRTFAGPFGQCLQTIRIKQPTEDYPCLKYWDYAEQSPTCEFFTKDNDCAEMYVENQCGGNALRAMRKDLIFITEHFGCSKTESRAVDQSMMNWDIL